MRPITARGEAIDPSRSCEPQVLRLRVRPIRKRADRKKLADAPLRMTAKGGPLPCAECWLLTATPASLPPRHSSSASAASSAAGSLPPASAMSGRPPPEPPTFFATSAMILPACTRDVRSLVTPTISATLAVADRAHHHHARTQLVAQVIDQRAQLRPLQVVGARGQHFHAFHLAHILRRRRRPTTRADFIRACSSSLRSFFSSSSRRSSSLLSASAGD